MAANWQSQPSDCDVFDNGVLTRLVNTEGCWSGLLYTDSMVRQVINSRSYDALSQPYDFSDFEANHGSPHMFLGGHMEALPCAPLDPYFWSHHCFVDMLAESLKDRLPAAAWRYPNSWWIPFAHRPDDRMLPFEYTNAEGMDDDIIGRNYIYEQSPAEYRCTTEADCSPTGLLWCDTAPGTNRCKAKCRQGGSCTRGIHAMCHCMRGRPRCDTGTCQCM